MRPFFGAIIKRKIENVVTLYQFNAMDEMEQIEALWEHGVHITERQDGEYRLILYQIDSFYVEVWYHMEDNDIRRFRSFSSITQLEPYLKNIEIKF